MLHLDGISLTYHAGTSMEVPALRNVGLRIAAGEFVTVVGSNGAGKSSLVQIVSGAVRPTAGRVLVDGRDVTRWPDHRRAALVARVFDNPHAGTAPQLSIEENMALALARGSRRRLRFALTGSRRDVMRERLAVLGLGLEARLSDPVTMLSAGQRQSLTMVMAGLTRPKVLLLDEHLAALDPGTQRTVLDLTVRLARDSGCASLMITHNMEQAITVGDRLLVMSRGRVIADVHGAAKRALTVSRLIDLITGAGDVVSDRAVLVEATTDAERRP
ncbi:ATP-binding cassette domain-containing protein [Dactylosporangium sp. AC04546]|uniref:ABC transporter ATP-binding protein n=1 Tax=Dactylosporangium sp. AC04546 TaxID=2862460 RepID=UPI001EDCB058|nr:ATP-binding cassette domain-containing protein [Dactylosporangium sp. AC04546]WVK89001.1 ATP-binding cassette domain-containing protein [Dactylosporangium sp. AC04546]